ncbi:hypothetical protein BDQ12DRAFT_497981 [Crucibulum laeve]|uniref:Uncharacterized protein n=1 Tax=Crucibulum laeve TaxID=68775 RepID=A0A5C3LHL6_9AGAR|nr:hypothetical protein BDQ12DRAFT_497981 [Crucibulum laeve]
MPWDMLLLPLRSTHCSYTGLHEQFHCCAKAILAYAISGTVLGLLVQRFMIHHYYRYSKTSFSRQFLLFSCSQRRPLSYTHKYPSSTPYSLEKAAP